MKNYSKKLAKAKSVFNKAHDKTASLMFNIQQDIKKKEAKIDTLREEIQELSTTQNEARQFMANLNKFVE